MVEGRRIRFATLGPISAVDDGADLALGSTKQRSVLAVLLLNANSTVSRDQVIDAVWGASPPASAANLVAVYVAGLRKVLEPWREKGAPSRLLSSTGTGYCLNIDPSQLDLLEFEEATQRARQAREDGDLETCAVEFDTALAYWRGEPLDGACGPFVDAQRQRLTELRLTLTEERLDAALALGRHGEEVANLTQLVAVHPLRERLRSLLMLALYRSGRQAEALGVYDDTRRLLASELGIDPSPELQELHRQLLVADPAMTSPQRMPTAMSAVVPAQLPADISDFTGRDAELGQIHAVFTESETGQGSAVAILALTGTGGVGKTSLAIHSAHGLRDRFPDGQLFVNLQGARVRPLDPHDVLARFLQDLGVEPTLIPDDPESRAALYRTTVSERRLLIVLDNAHDAAQVRPLLPGTASAGVLVTSRARLADLEAVHLLSLDVLTQDDALAVLSRVAGADRVAAEPVAAAEVVRACARLPLALRIAGVRLATRPGWTIGTLADRLRDERSRLEELTAGDLAVQASFLVSYQNLPTGDPDAARAFRLASLTDGADLSLAAAAALLGLPEDEAETALEHLVDAHLIQSPVPDRYRYHDLVRLFARSLAGPDESRAALERTMLFYLGAAGAADQWLRPGRIPIGRRPFDPDAAPAFASHTMATAWLAAERANIVGVGLQAAADPGTNPALVAELVAELREFLYSRGHWNDLQNLAEAALTAAVRDGHDGAIALASLELGIVAVTRHHVEEAERHLGRSIQLFAASGDGLGQARALNALGIVYIFDRQDGKAIALLDESLVHSREHGDRNGEIASINNLAMLALRGRRPTQAITYARRCLELTEEAGPLNDTISALHTLGGAYGELGQHSESIASNQEGYRLARASGDAFREGQALTALAKSSLAADHPEHTVSYAERALGIHCRIGFRYGQATALEQLGHGLAALDQPTRALVCWQAALEIFERIGSVEGGELRAHLASENPMTAAAT